MTRPFASAQAAKHYKTGERVYKPVIKNPSGGKGNATEVVCRGWNKNYQGDTFATRQEAIAAAQEVIDMRRDDVAKKAASREWAESSRAYIQGEYELWGGVGDLFGV